MSTPEKLSYQPQAVPEELREALAILQAYIPLCPQPAPDSLFVRFRSGGQGLSVRAHGAEAEISYSRPCEACRALGILSGRIRTGAPIRDFTENPPFSLISVMLDVSRNAVMKVDILKAFLARFALMGVNGFMLYAECNYEIPGEDFWGYNTGGYSIEELRELDRFAAKLGIEMFPCIQALAHLRRALQWEAYGAVKDTETVLLVDEEQTYRFLEKAISAASQPFGSRRINVGMDEAWDLGLGNYLRRHGYRSRYELMSRHLKRVMEIVEKLDLDPMMCADMFFRAGSLTGAYYDTDVEIPQEVKGAIPPEMALIYWDYYHFDEGFYRRFIDRHLELVSLERLVMAPGAQTWNRFWTNYPYAVATIDPAMKVCREKGIRQLMITLWGDDGNECDPHSFLPMIQFFSDHAYRGEVKPEDLKENLWGSCGIDYHSWHPAGEIDAPAYLEKEELGGNPAKILLWEDPLYGLLQPMLGKVDLGDHFRRIAEDLDRVRRRKRPEDRPLLLPLLLCRILAVKWDLPNRIYSAYRDGRRAALKEIIKKDIPFLRREIEKMRQLHRRNWHEALQPWGWETLDSRYGSLLARLETLQTRLSDYLGRRIPSIPELERERRKIFDIPDGRLPNLRYGQVYTATLNAVN